MIRSFKKSGNETEEPFDYLAKISSTINLRPNRESTNSKGSKKMFKTFYKKPNLRPTSGRNVYSPKPMDSTNSWESSGKRKVTNSKLLTNSTSGSSKNSHCYIATRRPKSARGGCVVSNVSKYKSKALSTGKKHKGTVSKLSHDRSSANNSKSQLKYVPSSYQNAKGKVHAQI